VSCIYGQRVPLQQTVETSTEDHAIEHRGREAILLREESLDGSHSEARDETKAVRESELVAWNPRRGSAQS
jgi:hypothetical protein